jgi:competence protein ComEC
MKLNCDFKFGLAILCLVLIYRFVDRDSLIGVFFKTLPPKEAALMAGMVLGDQNNFNKEMINNFRDNGVVHIMVVSGTNIILVFKGIVENLAGWLGRKKAIGFGFGVILLYMNWVGWQIPAIRAFLLMAIFYWAQLLGRKFNLWRAIILVVLIMVLADYRVVFEISFYLSFVAFVAVVINPIKGKKWWSDLWDSFWVNLWLSPILFFCFGKISWIAPISNALILFSVEMITILGLVGGVVGLVLPILGKMILWTSLPFLKYILLVVEVL